MLIRYFAYGSNLDAEQMRRRCPGSRPVCRATLTDHRLTFPLACAGWGGGVAGIDPAPGHCVEGMVYELTEADLAVLDGYENLEGGDYRRERIEVRSDAGERMEVWTYLANPAPEGPTPPSGRYLAALIRGARHHGLPSAYIASLEAVPTRSG